MKRLTMLMILALGLGSFNGYAQHRDFSSMSNAEFLNFLAQRNAPEQQGNIEQATPGVKCGFDVTFESIRRRDMMNGSELALMEKLLAPPSYQIAIFSPTGRFKIHYDTTGSHAPAMLDLSGLRIQNTYHQYAQEVAAIYDYVYEREVVELGYDAPPNPPYEVYLSNLGSSLYGATQPVGLPLPSNTAAPLYNSYIEMDNDFRGYPYAPGLDGARVTAAHEFHHMIQLGRYGSWGTPERYIYEMTSTHFEDVVYPDVNDYYQYLPDHFGTPHRSFYENQGALGYEKAIFLQMLEKKYGPEVIRRGWEQMKLVDPANAFQRAIVEEGSDYGLELCSFGRWCYFTSYRAGLRDFSERFDEAERFPKVEFEGLTQLNGGRAEFQDELAPYGSQYFRVYHGADTVCIFVTNTDWSAAITTGTRGLKTPYTISVVDYQPGDPYTPLTNGWAYKFESTSAHFFCVTAIVGDIPEEAPISTPYPNPFYPDQDHVIRFPMPAITTQQRANVYIYTTSMNLVYHSDDAPIMSAEGLGRFMEWNGRTQSGDVPPTGVYVYSIKFGDEVRKGKFAVVRR